MKKNIKEVIEAIKIYQTKTREIDSIQEQMNNLKLYSEYSSALEKIIKEFINEGLYISALTANLDDSYNELLLQIENGITKKKNDQLSYDENDLIEYYNGMNEEEKKQYGSYEAFKKQLLEDYNKEIEKQNKKIDELFEQFKNLKPLFDERNKELASLNEKKQELLSERWELLEGRLKNYNIDLLENGFKYQNGFLAIDDSMKLVTDFPKFDEENFSLDDLIMVHVTEYFPKNGVIKSLREATGARRNTIHTALNCHVGSHMYGNWVGHPIVIVDPLNKHVDQLACIYSVDTYTYGSMKLSDDAIILIDSSKFNEIYQQNKEYIDQNRDRVILFSGDSSKIVEQVIGILGYAPQKTGTWSWENKHNDDMLNQYVQNNYPNILNSPHMATPHKIYEESWVRNILLPQYGYDSLATDKIITPEILYIIRKRYENTPTEDFIRNVGVFVDENEIHLLGMKDYLELWKSKDAISPQQVRKIDMITEKYELMQKYQEENSHSK